NLDKTPDGEAQGIHDFVFNTISCGRTNTAMPTWSSDYGGPMSRTQIEYLTKLITSGRWDLVEEIGAEHDAVALDQEAAAYALFGKAYGNPFLDKEDAKAHLEKALTKDTLAEDKKTVIAVGEKSIVDRLIAYRNVNRLDEAKANLQPLAKQDLA